MKHLTDIASFLWFLFVFYIPCSYIFPIPLILLATIEDILSFPKIINTLYTSFVIKFPLRTQYNIINPNKRITSGIIISNHKSGFDNIYDSHVTNSILIADAKIKWYHGLYYLLQNISRQVYVFDKKNTNRHSLYSSMKTIYNSKSNYIPRMLFYPEGTRVKEKYHSVEHLRKNIKYGLLKSIYENKDYPVQLFISKNKDNSFINKTCGINHVVSIYSNVFIQQNFDSFDHFVNEITQEWINCLEVLK